MAGIARADAATALVLTMTYLQHRALVREDSRWPEALRQRVYASAVEQGALINALRVEPELGSPSRGGLPATVARRDGDGWRLSGHKIYSTGVPALRWLAVWARTDEAEPRVGVFLVPREARRREGSEAIRVIESWNHLGLRASGSHEVVFDEAWIPFEHAADLRAPADWLPSGAAQADSGAQADQQAWMIALLGGLYDAVARAARDWLLGFVNTRAPASLGAPLATLPRVQETLGEIEALLLANRVLLDELTERADAGAPPDVVSAGLVKYTVTNHAIRVTELALQLSGNHGLSRHHPLERHHRDVLCSRIHTPAERRDPGRGGARGGRGDRFAWRGLRAAGEGVRCGSEAGAAAKTNDVSRGTSHATRRPARSRAARCRSGGQVGRAERLELLARRLAHRARRRREPLHAVALGQPEIDRRPEIADVDDLERRAQRARLDQRQGHQAEPEAVRHALQLHVAAEGVERDRERQPLRVERALQAGAKAAAVGIEHPAARVQLGEPVAALRAGAARGHHGQARGGQALARHVRRQGGVARHEHQRGVELAQRELVEQRAGPAGLDARRHRGPALAQHRDQFRQHQLADAVRDAEPERAGRRLGGAHHLAQRLHLARSTARHWSCTRRPRSVGRGGLVLRSSSSTPSASSRFCTRRVMAGCVMPSSCAAWLRDWQRITAANASISPIFMLLLHAIRSGL